MNASFMGDQGWGQAQTPVLWRGHPMPEKWHSLSQLRQLLPDVLPPASKWAVQAAMFFVRTGVPAHTKVKPEFDPSRTYAVVQGLALYRASYLADFVLYPEVAFLFDEWCMEDPHG